MSFFLEGAVANSSFVECDCGTGAWGNWINVAWFIPVMGGTIPKPGSMGIIEIGVP
jgi:hypothetical protein